MNQQILVIDDSDKVHALVKAILSDEPVDVHSATDPKYGLVLAESLRPDLILLDVDMPGMDGFEACAKLKADSATTDIPVIFLTSVSSVKQKVKGFNLGAVDYVAKPFYPTELKARVRASLLNEKLMRSLEQMALIDPLTGLGNRAMFDSRYEAEVCLRVRVERPLSCILLDVDHFKEINDTFGHPIGDRVLQMSGKVIADLCRTEDVACRFGGEEFVIIAPNTNGADATIFAERIREIIADTRFKPEGLEAVKMNVDCIRVTASFGVAEAANSYDRSMLQRADRAMYLAKQEGRNRVSLAETSIKEQEMAA